MAAAPAWRQFTFFDVAPVKDVHDLDSPPDIFKAALELSCVTSSSVGVLAADIHGSIHLLNRDFESVLSWVAHLGGHVTHMAEQNGVLVTIGEEANIRGPILKVFDLATRDPKPTSAPPPPLLLRFVKLGQHHTFLKPFPVSCIALSLNLAHFAVGFADGTVLLYRHLDQSLSSSTSLTTLPKVRVVHEPSTAPVTAASASTSATPVAATGPGGFTIPTAGSEPITGLGFKQPTDEIPNTYLFIATTSHVLSYQVSGKGSGAPAMVVDEIGCGLGCARMDWRARDMLVAREEAIYLCGTEGRGACFAYEGHKSSIHTHRHYLVIVSPPFTPTTHSSSATVRNFVRQASLSVAETDITKVVVFDLENKHVAYSSTFTQGVRDVVSQWGRVYIVTNDGNLLMLQEKPTQDKLDILYRKSLYPIALNLANTQGLDEPTVADIHKQYGDHLYAKGDYDSAMQQYLQTIGHLQASYVIRKFLDSQRIHNLITYLQELHSLGVANADHTTLLLNTYTKLKDLSRLDSFIKLESKRNRSQDRDGEPGLNPNSDELPFDLDTAIRVCRQAGYFEHASYLAKKYERHEDYLSIQIEDAGNYKDALQYLRMLGSEAAENNLARYGRALLDSLPDEMTQLLIDLCTTTGPLPLVVDADEITAQPTGKHPPQSASYLSYLSLGRSSGTEPLPVAPSTVRTARQESSSASHFDSVLFDPNPNPNSNVAPSRPGTPSTLMAATATTTAARSVKSPLSSQVRVQAAEEQQRRRKISPRLYFAHFVDHMEQFVVFLEAVAARRWGQTVDEVGVKVMPALIVSSMEGEGVDEVVDEQAEKTDQVAVWNTLLELYLTLPRPGVDARKDSKEGQPNLQESVLRKKAINVLQSDFIPYDSTHALILCSGHGYTDGLVLLWERLGMYEDVLRFWMDREREGNTSGASDKVVSHLKTYGPSNPRLYPLVLRFLTSSSELLTRHQEDVRYVLEHIDREGILPPLGVVQVLSRNGVASVGLVKEWLVRRIKDAKVEIQNDRELTISYRSETGTKLRQVRDLSNPDQPRVFHVTRCSACSGQLDLPSIHFMCDHSYHQRCLGEHDQECPTCAKEHGLIQEIRRNNKRLAEHHDVFLQEVRENGFEAVSAAFGRGLLNSTRLVDEVV
ncbi:hypothetical protein AX15_001433 [Amanita polypyramis BW_CC]|nr:hypothetical protein AX15_001433 [Amanita polypyramis BW_CC]